jgi:hypothetical protein
MGGISKRLWIILALLLALPIAFAASTTEISMYPSTGEENGAPYIQVNFSVIYTESLSDYDYTGMKTDPTAGLNIRQYEQTSLQNAKVYFYIKKSGDSKFTLLGSGTTDTPASVTLSDGTLGTMYSGIATFQPGSEYKDSCSELKAEFRGESSSPGDYSTAEKSEQVCFGIKATPALISNIILQELANPSNNIYCIPILILMALIGGAFYYRGGQGMLYLFDFTSPRLPHLNQMRFKWSGYGWHGRFGDATSIIASIKNITKYTKLGKDMEKVAGTFKDKNAGNLARVAMLAGMTRADLELFLRRNGLTYQSSLLDIYRPLQQHISLKLGIKDRDSINQYLRMMKTFRMGAEKMEYGKSHVRAQYGPHAGIVKGVIGGLQRGSLMAVILDPMKYAARVAKAIAPENKAVGAFEKMLEKVKADTGASEAIFRRLHEPLNQYIGRLNGGQYIIRPIFATYFAFLPNIGKWKESVRAQRWAREILGLSAKDLGDVMGRLSNELRRNMDISFAGKVSLREGGNADRMLEAYDRESSAILLKGMMGKILNDSKLAKSVGMTRDELALLNALKGADLSNLKKLAGNVGMLQSILKKMKDFDKQNSGTLQSIAEIINKEESSMTLAKKHSDYKKLAKEIFKGKGAEYDYFMERCKAINGAYASLGSGELKDSAIKKGLVVWKLNSALDSLAAKSGIRRTVFNDKIMESKDASQNMLADMFYSLAKSNKGKANLSNAFGLVYLEKINNTYGFLPSGKEDIKAILERANASSVSHLPKEKMKMFPWMKGHRENFLIPQDKINEMAESISVAMAFANKIAKDMINRKEIPKELKYLEKDNNYLMFFNARALKKEIDKSQALSQAQKDNLVNNFVLGEKYKDIFKNDVKTYLFGTGARHTAHTYLDGRHWAYLRNDKNDKDEDPFAVKTSFVPTSRRFSDLGETEETLKFVGLWDVFYRREKGMFKKAGSTGESVANALMAQLVGKGAENDDRLFTLISDRSTTLQSKNMLTFGTRYIHMLDYIMSGGKFKPDKEMEDEARRQIIARKKDEDRSAKEGKEYSASKEEISDYLKANRSRVFDAAMFNFMMDQDNRLVTLKSVKGSKDFLFMNGELGDILPMRADPSSMNSDLKKLLVGANMDLGDKEKASLSFQNMARASTEKVLNMRISYIGDHGNIYKSLGELADTYRITDKSVIQFMKDLAGGADKEALKAGLERLRTTVSDPQQVAIAAFRYAEKTRDFEPLLNRMANVKVGTVADIDQQRMEAWKGVFRSGNPAEALSGLLLYGKEQAIDKFTKFHETVLYTKTLQIGSEDLFGIENQENRILREGFAVLDEYGALNKILARMERGADESQIDFLKQFKSRQDAEEFIRLRMGDLQKSFIAFEWFMTRDVHPIYGGAYPYYREGLTAASLNAGVSTLKQSWIDQMWQAYRRENIESYPSGLNWALDWLSRETIRAHLPLQQAFAHAVRFEEKMSKGVANPYEIRYEADDDVKRAFKDMGLDSIHHRDKEGSMLYGRFVEPGTIRGPMDQFLPQQGLNIGYTLSGMLANLGSGSKVGLAGIAALVGGPALATIPGVYYAGKFANDLVRDRSRAMTNFWTGTETSEGFDAWKRTGGEKKWDSFKKFMAPVGKWMSSVNPNEGSAIADKEETHSAKRVSSHFYWYSNEFATPADIPGREHYMFGTGKRVIEPGEMWKVYNLYEARELEQKKSGEQGSYTYKWEYKEPKVSSVRTADTEDLAYASLSIRKRQNNIVEDYFKREQEAEMYSPSKSFMGAMINPFIATNVISGKTEKILNNLYMNARDSVQEEGWLGAAKKFGGATADFFAEGFSAPLNAAAVTLGGTNYMMKCSYCGALIRRGAGSCPQCKVKYK